MQRKQCCCAVFVLTALATLAMSAEENRHKVAWRTPLKEVGQSDVIVHGDHVYLTIHAPLKSYVEDPPASKQKAGKSYSSNIIGQCFDKQTGNGA